jgi:hypothetical protein
MASQKEPEMARSKIIPTTSLMAVIAAVGVLATGRAPAAEPQIAGMQVISSDKTARFVPLVINKAVVFELPTDIRDVLIGNPKIANAVVRSKRRIYIIATAIGQTNVYLFDADGRQIAGLDISVTTDPVEDTGEPVKTIVVYRSADDKLRRDYSCAPTCRVPAEPTPELPIQRIINENINRNAPPP